jgi:cysteine-rich repeat protein
VLSLINRGINYAAAAATTGAYVDLSCYYLAAPAGTPVPVLDQFGVFTVVGQGGCPADSHIIAVHPALAGLTDADLSNWVCSVHEGFDSWPVSFLPLAISLDIPSTFVAPDGTSGAPYIMAQGPDLSPILCGNGVIDGAEQCDDGNVINGDGCSAQCTLEEDVNDPPVCEGASADAMQLWPPNHKLANVGIAGVTDPDGDDVTITITGVTQDEVVKVNKGDKSPDAKINADSTVAIRVERDAMNDGRVYRIGFTADDGNGGTCSGTVRTCVPHDQGQGNDCVDTAPPSYNSLLP